MKTTLNIDDRVMARLREEAARQKRSMSELVESALRLLLQPERGATPKLSPLPRLKSGGHAVNIADRDALFRAMEDR